MGRLFGSYFPCSLRRNGDAASLGRKWAASDVAVAGADRDTNGQYRLRRLVALAFAATSCQQAALQVNVQHAGRVFGALKPDDAKGFKGWVTGLMTKRAGAGVTSANRITLLRDSNGDGLADFRSVLLEGLNSPFGIVLVGNDLYVADSDAVLRFPYVAGDTQITVPGNMVVALPAGPINHHWTKNLIASPDGSKLYVTVGSNSNVAERGMDVEAERAAIWEVEIKSGAHRVFASGQYATR